MKMEDIPFGQRYAYSQECNCGKHHLILTQHNDKPEYETALYLHCDCGEFVAFVLPVN